MTDPYANFVVQKALDRAVGPQRAELTKIVHDSADLLGRFTYGRHILGHVNAMLAAAGAQHVAAAQQLHHHQQMQLGGGGSSSGAGSPHFSRPGMPRGMMRGGAVPPPRGAGFYARNPTQHQMMMQQGMGQAQPGSPQMQATAQPAPPQPMLPGMVPTLRR
jgi:hypothetical protein